MRVTTHGQKYVGRVELLTRVHKLSPAQREQLAFELERIAEGVREMEITGTATVDLYVEDE